MPNPSIQLHTHVWRVRAEIDHIWLTPAPLDALRYAVTEVGEAMFAWLRARRPDDARNRYRRQDVLDELADCAIMLASALPADAPPTTVYPISTIASVDDVAQAVANALGAVPCNQFHAIEWALALVFAYPGFSLDVALSRLELIRVKYA